MRSKRIQDCFLIEIDLLRLADKQAEDECSSRASVYRRAIINYLKANGKELTKSKGIPSN